MTEKAIPASRKQHVGVSNEEKIGGRERSAGITRIRDSGPLRQPDDIDEHIPAGRMKAGDRPACVIFGRSIVDDHDLQREALRPAGDYGLDGPQQRDPFIARRYDNADLGSDHGDSGGLVVVGNCRDAHCTKHDQRTDDCPERDNANDGHAFRRRLERVPDPAVDCGKSL